MAKVPTYEDFQAQPQALAPVRADAAMTPAMAAMPGQQQQQLGQAMSSLGQSMANIAIDAQRDINDAQTKQGDNTLSPKIRNIVTGYLSLTGGAAVSQDKTSGMTERDGAIKRIDDEIKSTSGTLANDAQTKMFGPVAAHRREQAIQSLDQHYLQQSKIFNKSETQARAEEASQNALVAAPLWNQSQTHLADLTANKSDYNRADWGKRIDGSDKGLGYLGVLKAPTISNPKDVATEYTTGVQINGKEVDIPVLVPGLSREQVQEVLKAVSEEKEVSPAILAIATKHAEKRIANGLSVFAEDGEQPQSNAFSMNKSLMVKETVELARQSGYDADSPVTRQAVLAANTKLHGGVIDTFLAADKFPEAKKYFQAFMHEVDPEKRDVFKKALDTAGVADQAIKLSGLIWKMEGDKDPVKFRDELDRRLALPEEDPNHIDANLYEKVRPILNQRLVEYEQSKNIKDVAENKLVSAQAIALTDTINKAKPLTEQLADLKRWYDNSSEAKKVAILETAQQKLAAQFQVEVNEKNALVGVDSTTIADNIDKSLSLSDQLKTVNGIFEASQKTAHDSAVRDAARTRVIQDYSVTEKQANDQVIPKAIELLGKIDKSKPIDEQLKQAESWYETTQKNPNDASIYKHLQSEIAAAAASKKTAEDAKVGVSAASIVKGIDPKKSLADQIVELGVKVPENTDHEVRVFKEAQAILVANHNISKSADAEKASTSALAKAISLSNQPFLKATAIVNKMYLDGPQTPADKIFHDTVLAELGKLEAIKKNNENEFEKAQLGAASKWFIEHQGSSMADFQKAHPALYTSMAKTGHLPGLLSLSKGTKIETDPAVMADILTNSDALKGMTPTQIYNKFSLKVSEPDLNKLYALRSALNGSTEDQHLSIMSTTEMVKDSAAKLGIIPATGKPSDAQAKAFIDYQRNVDAKIAAYETTVLQGKRKASQEELQKILQSVEQNKVYEPRTFLPDKEVSVINGVSPDAYVIVQNEEIKLSSIPANQRALIITALRQSNRAITEQAIAEYWVRGGKLK